jgi:hypothetical protein
MPRTGQRKKLPCGLAARATSPHDTMLGDLREGHELRKATGKSESGGRDIQMGHYFDSEPRRWPGGRPRLMLSYDARNLDSGAIQQSEASQPGC